MDFSDDNYLFQCPACRQHISDDQIHDHIQNCEFYYHHSSHSISYSSMRSSFDGSYNYNRNSDTSSESESQEGSIPDFSARHKQMTPSNTQSIAMCPVCFEHFHNTRNAPLLLPNCGHTVCKPCLKNIRDQNNYLSCPICRALNKGEIRNLPINYALLDLTDKTIPTKCQEHEHDFVAYCKEDDKVLCGACVLDHREHSCLLLSDPSLKALLEDKQTRMTKDFEDLLVLKKTWNSQKQEMEILTTMIKGSAELHKSKINETEAEIIKNIQEGSRICFNQLNEFIESDAVKKINFELNSKLAEIDKKIGVLGFKVEKFEELTMAEKLKAESFDKEKFLEVPDLTHVKKLNDRLKVKFDYHAAIQNKTLGL